MFNQHLKVFGIETFSSIQLQSIGKSMETHRIEIWGSLTKNSIRLQKRNKDSFIPPSSIKRMCKVPVINISSASAVNPLIIKILKTISAVQVL